MLNPFKKLFDFNARETGKYQKAVDEINILEDRARKLKDADFPKETAKLKKEVTGGNAGLTVGGTGDVLAGLTAGLLAQKIPLSEASVLATTLIKKSADRLLEEYGYAYTARKVIDMIPRMLKEESPPHTLHG